MDYQKLAEELLESMSKLSKFPMQKNAERFVRGEMLALTYLSHHDALSPGEISAEMNISTARTAKLLDSLGAKGLIIRAPDCGDKRKIRVKLTDAGASHIEAYKAHVLSSVCSVLQGLGEKDAEEYVRIMKRIIDNTASKSENTENNQ